MEVKKTLLTDQELKKEYEVTIPKEIVILKADEEILEIQKTYKLNGFRSGKVPVNIIRDKEWVYIFDKACRNAVNETTQKLIEENGYDLSARPDVSIETMKDNEDVKFKVVYELLPEIETIDLDKVKIDKYEITIGESDIEKSIKKLLSTYRDWKKKEGTAELGNSVKIDFTGTINGEEFEGGKAEGYQLELGSHSFIDNFEEQVVGKTAGDIVDVNVTFPDNYHKSSLAGKPAIFKVKVLEVLEASDKELTDEFVKSTFGTENVEKFKELIQKELTTKCENATMALAREKVVDSLAGMIDFNLPEKMVNEQFKNLRSNKQKENIRNSITDPINEEELKKEAKKIVKANLIISRIGKDNDITTSDSEVTQAIMKNVMSMPNYEKQIIDFYKKNYSAVIALKEDINRTKILDFIVGKVNKNVINTTIDEFEKMIKSNSRNV